MDALTLLVPAPVASANAGIEGAIEPAEGEGASDFAALLAAGLLPQPPLPGIAPLPPAAREAGISLERAAPDASGEMTAAKQVALAAAADALVARPGEAASEIERATARALVAQAASPNERASGAELAPAAAPLLAGEPASFAATDALPRTALETTERESGRVALPAFEAPAGSAQAALPLALMAGGDTQAAVRPSALLEVAAPLDTPEFAPSLARQVVWMADRDAQIAEIRIDPPELGPVEVRLTLSGDEASVQFAASHAEVRSALESAIAKLRESMAQAGIQLGEASVSSESFREQSEALHAREQRRGYGQDDRGDPAGAMPSASQRLRQGLVDLFA